MDRRLLLKGFAGFTAMLGLGGLGKATGATKVPSRVSGPLAAQLFDLSDPHFGDYAKDQALPELYLSLMDKDVISLQEGVRHEQVILLANLDPHIVYRGFYYTRTELELYALALLLNPRPPL